MVILNFSLAFAQVVTNKNKNHKEMANLGNLISWGMVSDVTHMLLRVVVSESDHALINLN